MAREWARRDPANAAAWIGNFAEGEGVQRAIGEVMWNWTSIDPESASQWLAERPASGSRDIGAMALAKAAWANDPERAMSWLVTINDQVMRQAAIERGLRDWMEHDAASARAWAVAKQVPLPDGG